MKEARELRKASSHSRIGAKPLLLVAFSIFYFTDVFLRASAKYFWYDELLTLYFSRLANLHELWNALRSGTDFNPPGFYIITRIFEIPFGAGLIAARLPEMIGFWILCLCLFRVVSRRAGMVAGALAMLLPMLTGAFYYAYEARPHAVVLGFVGLSFLCWQMICERPASSRWVAGFGLSLFGAFMMHCYALAVLAPFGLAEIFVTLRRRDIRVRVWIAMITPAIPALLLYMPLLRSYRKLTSGTDFSIVFPPNFSQVNNFYVFLLTPCMLIVVAAVLLTAADRLLFTSTGGTRSARDTSSTAEVILSFGLAALPLCGIAMGKLVHGPFFARYFLSALIGICFLMAAAASVGRVRNWVAPVLLFFIVCLLGFSVLKVGWHRLRHRADFLTEPSTGLILDTVPGEPLAAHPLLVSDRSSVPVIAVLNPLEFLYLVHYAPGLRSRLYFASPSAGAMAYRGFQHLLPWSTDKYNPPLAYDDLMKKGQTFAVYADDGLLGQLPPFLRKGAEIRTFQSSNGHYLVKLAVGPSK